MGTYVKVCQLGDSCVAGEAGVVVVGVVVQHDWFSEPLSFFNSLECPFCHSRVPKDVFSS